MQPVTLLCADGYHLSGTLIAATVDRIGTAVVMPATAVKARYYARYAAFLAGQGFDVLTFDYRGIGASRPQRLRGSGITWHDWGQDIEAAITFICAHDPQGLKVAIGHSAGGFLIGFAASAQRLDRILTIGAQYAYWRDYAPDRKILLLLRWHLVMPVLTWLCGMFPGKWLGWLEDMPKGVANQWSFRGARLEAGLPPIAAAALRQNFASVQAPILAVAATDDEYATLPALRRTLAYFTGSQHQIARIPPGAFGLKTLGHFSLFHDRHRGDFWPMTWHWLATGVNPF